MCQEQFEHRPEPSEADVDEESELRKKRRTLGECHAAHTKHTHEREIEREREREIEREEQHFVSLCVQEIFT
jgi:hypothetical protein